MRTMRSLSVRSTSHPACIEIRRMGKDAADATSPTMNALFESSNASHPSDIDCIHVPMSESVCPNQNNRKFRWRWRVWNGFSEVGGCTA